MVPFLDWIRGVRTIRYTLITTRPLQTPFFTGPVVRQSLGAAIYQQGDAAFTAAFKPNNQRPAFSLDSSTLDQRRLAAGDRWSLRLTVFQPDVAPILHAGLETCMALGLFQARTPQVIDAYDVEPLPTLPEGSLLLSLLTPTELRRGPTLLDDPTGADLLHGVRFRLRELGVSPAGLPVFEDPLDGQCVSRAMWKGHRYSTQQKREIPLAGLRGAWVLHPTAAQLRWLGLATLTGLGAGTIMGMGVVRVTAL